MRGRASSPGHEHHGPVEHRLSKTSPASGVAAKPPPALRAPPNPRPDLGPETRSPARAPGTATDVEAVPSSDPVIDQDREVARRDRRGALVLALTLAAVAGTLVVHVAPWIDEGLGISHDGFNASVWALGGRGARLDPIGNRLGGIQPDGFTYANHPPLVVWITALTGALSDEAPLALRLPALTASLSSLLLLIRLMLDAGHRRVEVAAGLAVAGTTGMFLTFGTMLDTPVVGLPFGLAVGLAIGVAITLAWVLWVTGGLGELLDQGGLRSGTPPAFVDRQQLYALDLYGRAALTVTALGLLAAVIVRRRGGAETSPGAEQPPGTGGPGAALAPVPRGPTTPPAVGRPCPPRRT